MNWLTAIHAQQRPQAWANLSVAPPNTERCAGLEAPARSTEFAGVRGERGCHSILMVLFHAGLEQED